MKQYFRTVQSVLDSRWGNFQYTGTPAAQKTDRVLQSSKLEDCIYRDLSTDDENLEAIQQEWDAAVERILAEDPGFDVKTALADPDFAQMLKLGVKMEDAYKARYFDDIMARRTTQTAKTVKKGVEARIRQRGARPSENGTNPGGAAVLKTDVSKLTPAQCEELERRAMRGQIITF